ncbi:MAG: hypothetical protein IIB77_05285, partial [Proteobacteria bacterium]|nr:hypothetical protein [Pseudomonadota bacterium]
MVLPNSDLAVDQFDEADSEDIYINKGKEKPMDEEQPRVIITKAMVGICHMQVCAIDDATDEEILEKCNAENLAGTKNGWGHV